MADHFSNPPPLFGDTTWTKVFVGGLAWETKSDEMHRFFQQFGEILEAVIIKDKTTGKSKGYGFVTFRDPQSARMACANPNPIICGRRANCNIAIFGPPRPPPSGGRIQTTASYGGLRPSFPPPPVIFPPYRYRSYAPNYTVPYGYGYGIGYGHGYGYGYGYDCSSSSPAPRAPFSSPSSAAAPYVPYYMNQGLFYSPMHQIITPSTGWETPQHTPTDTEGGGSGFNSPNSS